MALGVPILKHFRVPGFTQVMIKHDSNGHFMRKQTDAVDMH